MITRVVSGVVLAVVALALILAGGIPFIIAWTAAAALALSELYDLLQRVAPRVPPYRIGGIGAGVLLLLLLGLDPQRSGVVIAALLGIILSLSAPLVVPDLTDARRWGATVSGLVYVAALAGAILVLRDGTSAQGRAWILTVCAITWGTDTAAYFVGRAIGRHPFFHQISPNKTAEGAVGGLAGGVIGAAIVAAASGLHQSWPVIMLIALTGAVAAQAGDLVESALKRQAGVKDSGTIIPGHGGVLDRIDSLLFVGGLTLCWHLLLPS